MNISEDRLEAGDRRAMAQDIVLGEMVAKHAILVEVLVQIAFRHRAWPLGRVHGDEETRNGSNSSSTTDRLLLLSFSVNRTFDTKLSVVCTLRDGAD